MPKTTTGPDGEHLLELGAGRLHDLARERHRLEVLKGEGAGGKGVRIGLHDAELEHRLLADEVEGSLLVL